MNPPSRKCEIIEQALQEAVGGGQSDMCGIYCRILSKDVCSIDLRGTEQK